MARRFIVFFICFVLVYVPFISYSPSSASSPKTYLNPEGFIENKGQWASNLFFIGKTSFGKIGFGKSSIYFNVKGSMEKPENQVVQFSLTDASNVAPIGIDPYPTNYHFYQGRDKTKWVTNAKMYKSVQYHDVYPGIDLYYSMQEQNPKYEFHVNPGADPSKIKIRIQGASIKTDLNSLSYVTANGGIKDSDLFVYEKQSNQPVSASFRSIDDKSFGFQVGSYDQEQILVIDPVLYEIDIRGSSFINEGRAEALDKNGNLYMTGVTDSYDFPTTPGAYKPYTASPYCFNAFVTKFDPTVPALSFSLLIGGTGTTYDNEGCAIALTSNNQIVIAGTTDSSDFPVTPGAFQSTLHGSSDFFVCRFDETGSQLIFSTLAGGSNSESFSISNYNGVDNFTFNCDNPIALDDSNNVFLSGISYSYDFPLTPDNLKTATDSGMFQIVLFQLNAAGSNLLYSTYFGGTSQEAPLSLVKDDQNNIYIGGFTSSSDFYTTPGAFQESHNFYNWLGFITKFHSDPVTHHLSVVYSTLLGYGKTFVTSIKCDKEYNIVAASSAYSGPGNGDGYFKADMLDMYGESDIFISILNPDGTGLRYSTFIGGDGSDVPTSIDIDHSQFIYVTGYTRAENFPVTPDAFQSELLGYADVFLFRIDPTLSELSFSTYYGAPYAIGGSNDLIVTDSNLVYLLCSLLIGGGYCPVLPYESRPLSGTLDLPFDSNPSFGQTIIGFQLTIPLVFPPVPSLTLTASNNVFTLDWTGLAGDNPLEGFVLYRSVDGGPFSYFNDFGSSTLETIDNDIASGRTYRYYIEAYDDHGNYSGFSNTVSYTRPLAPTNLSTSSIDSSIVVYWNYSTPGSYLVNQYLIYRSEDPGFSFPVLAGEVASIQNYYKDSGVALEKKYYYKVLARDINRIDSDLSLMISGIATAGKPDLALSVQLNKTEFEKGDAVILKVYVHNLGNTPATNTVLSMLLPEALEFTSVDLGEARTINEKTIFFPIGNIPANSFKEINLICHVTGQVNADTTAVISFTATCSENVSATDEVNFTIKAKKTTTSSVSISVKVQDTQQDPVTGKRFINLGDPLLITYEIIGGSCPYTIYVNWGDGTQETIVIKCFQDLDGIIKHIYQSRGTFHVDLKIDDATGQSKNSGFDMDIR